MPSTTHCFNFAVSLWADGFHCGTPHPTDPEQCLFDNWWYASPASVAAELDDDQRNRIPDRGWIRGRRRQMVDLWRGLIGPAIEDDVAVFITQQRGVRSRGFKGAYLSGQEKRISRYHVHR